VVKWSSGLVRTEEVRREKPECRRQRFEEDGTEAVGWSSGRVRTGEVRGQRHNCPVEDDEASDNHQ
jgi:hypothetical protein